MTRRVSSRLADWRAESSRRVVVWFTGLPSSGKSTLARRTLDALRGKGYRACLLDGDEVRRSLEPAHGHDQRGRADFYETLARLAALLAGQGLTVLVAATAHRRAYREAARDRVDRFLEVHVATPLDVCAERDDKGLYAASRAGTVMHMPGIGVSYEPPVAADVVAAGGDDASAVDRILALLAPPPRARASRGPRAPAGKKKPRNG